ncbi:MAG TPA: hypothetical protein VEQ40_08745, partial [Pyrinomonadaceae bacterium]|nr:hypothetical protein [Pyrinomonadaceae bacterium]
LKRITTSFFCLLALSLVACAPADNANSNTTATTNTNAPAATATPAAQNLTASTERPQGVKDKATALGEADTASPKLRIAEPREGATITGSTVRLKLLLTSDKGYKPGKDPATGMGPHIHVILDNQPYEAYYNLDQPFELRNVTEGKHTIRVFASRPWHESYKNEGNFQIVTFTVKGGGDASKPTTTNTGQVMANANAGAASNANAGAQAASEGKDYSASNAGDVDPKKPMLTYSRPKGEYKGADADPIMIDFWLSNAKLVGDGGEYRVRYSVDGGEAKMLDKWQPIWLSGWTSGKHNVKLELVDQNGNVVANGDYNSTTREITVQK